MLTLRTPGRFVAWVIAVLACCLPATALSAPVASAAVRTADRMVTADPASWTPRVEAGRVLAIAQVGDQMVLGGTFTSVSAAGGSPAYRRGGLVAFDAATGAVNTRFAPSLNGAVNQVLPGVAAGTVLVAGAFSTVNGRTHKRLVLLNLADGSVNTSFDPPAINGIVKDMKRVGHRLVLGGTFTRVAGDDHAGIASLDLRTGRVDPFIDIQLTGHHNWTSSCATCAKGAVGAAALDVSPDHRTLVVVGNFRAANGSPRDQVVMIDLSGKRAAVRPDWATSAFDTRCNYESFDAFMRGVSFSPDGTFFVVVTTGGSAGSTLCDAAARFQTGARGTKVQPFWVARTGRDTLLSVAVTADAVFVGGHQRWLNNDYGADTARPGAVPRAGLAALDPRSGVPLSWNPGRNPRGVGAAALLVTKGGLWVGSDTNYIGSYEYLRPRIAFFPFAGGSALPAGWTPALPSDVYLGGGTAYRPGSLVKRRFTGSTTGPSRPVTASGIDWPSVRGAVQIDGALFFGQAGMLYRSDFDGRAFGVARAVDPYRDPKWCPVNTGSGSTVYCGVLPTFYDELAKVTALGYADGRLYYATAGSTALRYRWFSPDSGIVSAKSFPVSGTVPAGATALLISGRTIYLGDPANGTLSRATFAPGAIGAARTLVSGPRVDGVDWRARAVFLGRTPPVAPVVRPPKRPTKPVIKTVKVKRKAKVVVKWRRAAPRGTAIAGYDVQFRKKRRHAASFKPWRTAKTSSGTRYTWTRGKRGATYKVRVVAVSAAGSTPSAAVRFRIRK